MPDFLWNLDVLIFKFFNQTLSAPWLNQITPVLTDLSYQTWFKIGVPIVLILVFYKKYKRAGISYFLFLILSIATNDFIGGKVKHLVERPRPFQVLETGATQSAPAKENSSFYSNHTSNVFTAATFLSAFFPEGKIVFYIVAAVIGWTRIQVGVHYPSDVLVGALVGILIGYLFSRLAQHLTKAKSTL